MQCEYPDPSERIRRAIRAYMDNDRIRMSELLSIKNISSDDKAKEGTEQFDASGMLLSIKAMFDLIEGLLSGAADTIAACIDAFWIAEKYTNESSDKEWLGNRLARAACYLMGGLLQVFVGSYVRAGVNLTVAFRLLRDLENDVLTYTGDDADLVQSLGYLILALMNFFAIVIPPSITTLGEYLGVVVSKERFFKYIDLCNRGNGPFAYIAKLVLIYWVINSKNFMFDKIMESELHQCRSLMDECITIAPKNVVVLVMNASVCLGEGNPDGAIKSITNPCLSILANPEWSTMALAVQYKLGVAYLCKLEFDRAAEAFKVAADSIEKSGKWHYIPFMRTLQGLSYLASGHPPKKALDIFKESILLRDLGSVVPMPGDLWGARIGSEYVTLLKANSHEGTIKDRAIVDILYAMVTVLYQFEKIDFSTLESAILPSLKKRKGDAKSLVIVGENYRKRCKFESSVSSFDDAIEAVEKVTNSGGTDPDSVLAFSLVLQGAALCASGELESACEVLEDLDKVLLEIKSSKGSSIVGGLMQSLISSSQKDLVRPEGGELDLILSFRRNGLKRRIDELKNTTS